MKESDALNAICDACPWRRTDDPMFRWERGIGAETGEKIRVQNSTPAQGVVAEALDAIADVENVFRDVSGWWLPAGGLLP